jgi:mannan endo-1,4-beta-mannosidase
VCLTLIYTRMPIDAERWMRRLERNSYFLRHIAVIAIILTILSACTQSTANTANTTNSNKVVKNLPSPTVPAAPYHFVIHNGSSLMLDGKVFRFAGTNIYWLGLQEPANAISYPSHFRIDDALATAAFMGETVVRSHTLGISVGCQLCIEPSLGTFNQVALQHIDYAIWSARMHHIRLIIPFVDNWHYYHGGKHTFTDWRGLPNEQAFYYSSLVINDFEQYISVILNHVNSYTGIAYKDDPTILAWETGNELSAPTDWVRTISSYIKGIDPQHLIMDGNYEQADETSNFLSDLPIKSVDIYTGHYYPPNITALHTELNQVLSVNKVFIVGEYDWNTNTGDGLSDFLSAIEQSTIAGDMYWSLFSHDDTHGFVLHQEHFTLHYPGDTSDMRMRVSLLRAHAYTMQGLPMANAVIPGTPVITAINGQSISWRGAFGAATYSIERSTAGANGPWVVICDRCISDDTIAWIDLTQPSGVVVYRMQGYSVAGNAGPYSSVGYLQHT